MSKAKSEKEIKAEVKKLLEIKANPKFRRYSDFGDDHFRSIDIQVAVLEKDLDEDEINDRYENSDDNSTAYDAFQWREGEKVDESPSEGWKSLVRE